ncbi:MAG: D-alanyl-D-alanine carboxypeptidase family protein [Bradymonadaceae bacterium]|nr:D-alanyl-D-alanine carboxypeptidase family protein [Lujinxingiaceae bacterium]
MNSNHHSLKNATRFMALGLIAVFLLSGIGCTESQVVYGGSSNATSANPDQTDFTGEGEHSEAIEAGLMGQVFDFEYVDFDAAYGESQPVELFTEGPFRGVEVFVSGELLNLQYQVYDAGGFWTEWTTFAPEHAYAGMHGGIINLVEPGVAFRFRSAAALEYLRLEFFSDNLEAHDHSHEHEDDSELYDDADYLALGEADAQGDDDLSTRSGELRVLHQALITSCAKTKMAAYSGGNRLADITVIKMDGKNVGLNTGSAYEKMRLAAARNGVKLQVISGFRTMAEQQYLYNCYLSKRCNNGNLAARPGRSNHQNGLALDLNTRAPGVLNWLNRNAANYGFRRTVPSEAWHWEYRAGKTVSPQVCSGSTPPATTQPTNPTTPTQPTQPTTNTCTSDAQCTGAAECVNKACVKSGSLRFTLTWEANTDLDIHVLTPSGEKLWYRNRNIADGGQFDSDSCIGSTCATSTKLQMESVYWTRAATQGNYQVWAVNYSGTKSVPFTVDVTVGDKRMTLQSTAPAVKNGASRKFTISNPSGELIN